MIRYAVIFGFGVTACSAEPAAPPAAPPHAEPRSSSSVRWRPAREPSHTALLEAPARVVPAADARTVVSAPLRARVVAISARIGNEVAAGAPLLELAMPEAAAAAAAYLAAVDQLAAHQRRAIELAALRQEGLSRTSDLAAIELELARLRGARDVAAASLRAADLGVEDAAALAARGGRTVVRAPRAGRITRMTAVIGATVSPDEALVELAAGGSTRVEVALTHPIPPGSQFEIALASGTSAARMVGLAPDREPDGSTRAWLEVETPLPANALGRLRVLAPSGAAVSVPATAIAIDGAGAFVWRRVGDRPQRLPVAVLVTSGADALVTGPRQGDLVASVASAVSEEAP